MKRVLLFLLFASSCLGQGDPMQFAPFMMQQGLVTDWALRVVANGGAMPSQNTLQAMETLRTTLISMSLTNRIHSMCVFVPDSVIASATPLFLHKGYAMWTNTFVGGDLTVNGLKGDGSTKYMDTGVMAAKGEGVTSNSNCGLTVIVTEVARGTSFPTAGALTWLGCSDNDNDPQLTLQSTTGGALFFIPNDTASANNYVFTNDWCRVGYVSGNRDSNNNYIFVASPRESHKLLSTKAIGFTEFAPLTNTIAVFCMRRGFTNDPATFTTNRLSMAAIHEDFTETQSSNFWYALRTCREQLGGGTGDPIHDWNTFVQAAGGASVSVSTSNALGAFWSGLDTDATLYQVVAANAIVPDNLTAARVPLIWQGGNTIWPNINFGSTNLSVNGLAGNGTDKYLQSGITNNAVASRGFSATSAGISLLMHANPDTAGNGLIAVQGSGNSQFSLFSFAGTGLFRCWLTTLVNQNFVSAGLGTTTNGWLSGQRTAANAIALYKARSDTVHTLVTNATGAQSGSTFGTHANYVYCINNAGTAASFSAPTVSFAAFTSGMTQTQNSNLYVRVTTLRTALGGGSP